MSNKKKKANKRKNCSPLKESASKKQLFDMEEYLKTITEQNAKTLQNNAQIVKENAKIMKENQELLMEIKKHNEICEKQLANVNKNISVLSNKVNNLERIGSMKTINMYGIPVVSGETHTELLNTIKQLASFLKVPCRDTDIDDIYRCGKERKTVRVEFVTKLKKKEFINAVKNKEIKGLDIKINSNEQIFIFEHLSPDNHKLYTEARKLKKDNVVQFVWINHGTVLVRKKEGEKAIVIKSFVDILNLLPTK